MKRHNRPTLLFGAVLLVFGLAGCGPFGRGGAKHTVQTPPPPQPQKLEAPVIRPQMDPRYVAPIFQAAIEAPLRTPETDAVLREAADRFHAGEEFYGHGDIENARRMFDSAIDLLLESPEDALDRYRVTAKCRELANAIHDYDVAGLGAAEHDLGFEEAPVDSLLDVTFPVDPNTELTVVERLKLPGSQFPVEVNGEVMRYIKYFSSSGGRKTLVSGLRRLGRFKPMIQRILDEEGVPQELTYLGMIESGYQARAMSRKRATGLWQFMSYRGEEYGLNRSSFYDDRLDPEKATRAAAQHLRDLYEALGDWYLAMAAYNAGPGRVTRAVRRTGYADFWELSRRRVLPPETRRYVPIVLAMIIMANSPDEYGLEGVVPDPPVEYNTVEVGYQTHLGLVADILGRPIDEIRALNPALLKDIAPPGYAIHVPKGSGSFVLAALETVPASQRASWRVHRVGYGQTLSMIAELYEITAESIAIANGGVLTDPEAGDLVVVPVSYTGTRGADSRSSSSQPGRRGRPAAGASEQSDG